VPSLHYFGAIAKLRDVPYVSECTLTIRFIGPIFLIALK